jgi:hypothetical protein
LKTDALCCIMSLYSKKQMKLYKVVYETEIVILAENESEALSNAQYYVNEETPELLDWELVESIGQIPNWKGAIPYSVKRGYNVNERRCEEFVSQ